MNGALWVSNVLVEINKQIKTGTINRLNKQIQICSEITKKTEKQKQNQQ